MAAVGRPTSPDAARQIWAQIEQLNQSGKPATVENISEGMGQYYNWNMEEVRVKVYEAVESGLIVQSNPVDHSSPVFSVPAVDPKDTPERDWYCFVCHTAGLCLPCTTCFRVYHLGCLPESVPDESSFICPICQSLNAPCAVDEETLNKQLDATLTWVHEKGGEGFALPQHSVDLTADQCRLLIAKDMDLAAIKTNLNTQQYPTPRHFLADLQLLIHNICILHGKNGALSKLAEEILKDVKYEVAGIEGAVVVEEEFVGGDHGRGGIKRPPGRKSDDGSSPKKSRPAPGALPSKPMDVLDPMMGGGEGESWIMDEGFKKLLMDLQRHWLIEYQQSREKLMIDLTEKLHSEFLSDQQKIRTELLTQFKDELDTTRQELEQKYRDTLKQELQKMGEKHRKELSNAKKKQWCWQCEAEAIYHCCWNTAYCSVDCQQAHWPTHRKYCRRKKGGAGGGGGGGAKE